MSKLKSFFQFNKQQRTEIVLWIVLLAGSLSAYYFVDFGKNATLDIASVEVVTLQKEIDSLKKVAIEERKPKRFPFNPNFITDHKAYTLGMTPSEFDRLKAFRDKDQWINSVADFQKVTGVSDSVLAVISPLFKFPDWVTNPKPKTNYIKNSYTDFDKEKSFSEKIDLNIATEEELQQVSGIGEALSKRIVSYRDKLGGFSNDVQLQNVYGLRPDVIQRTLNWFTVKTPKKINKININTASASDIATVPGISFELAKEIWEFRKLRERIHDFSELEKIEGLTASKLEVIQLYLSL
ncbi:ComEA family DNA-binding protein [Jejudonia soesokkakensis]|uniref:ComEA family DNA-binding protein n=1 Tax=Jejudonia soesokkakensis TaxID=1323432 RepID=A0ABW2MSY0_9FLAO